MTDRFAILLRHGDYHQKPDTPSALQPFALTDTGTTQAREAGSELARLISQEGWRPSREIFCSRQLRAWQTASHLSEALTEAIGLTFRVIENEALAERSVGALSNLTIPEIEKILDDDPRCSPPPADWKSNSHYRLPVQGAESLMQAGERVANCISEGLENLEGLPEANVQIFVGHGAAMRHAAHHLGVLQLDEIKSLSMHHARPVVLKRTDGGQWLHHTGAWKQRTIKETAMD